MCVTLINYKRRRALSDPPGGEGDVLRAVEGRDRQPVQVHLAGNEWSRILFDAKEITKLILRLMLDLLGAGPAVPRDAPLDGPPLPRRAQLRRRRRRAGVLLARAVAHRRPGEHRAQRPEGQEQVGRSGGDEDSAIRLFVTRMLVQLVQFLSYFQKRS